MTFPHLALSVIGDEIGPSLDEMISFAQEHGLKRLDMRTVDGRNLLGMSKAEVIKISRTLEAAGISVPAFVSPLFKWTAPGKPLPNGKVDFAFDPKQCPVEDPIAHAIQIAVILGAPHMRIFSYLRYGGFSAGDMYTLNGDFGRLHGLAVRYDITLQLENEPVCNIGNVAELAAFFTPAEKPAEQDKLEGDDIEGEEDEDPSQPKVIYLRPLVDIALLAPLTTAIHLKDRDLTAGRTVPLGDGDVPWPAELRRLLGGIETKQVLASIETHCPQDSRDATARSLAGLRRIAAEIGVEVV